MAEQKNFFLSAVTDRVWELVERREHLCDHAPRCVRCGTNQVQLTAWATGEPALWKCRHCKKQFSFEPAKAK